MELLRLIKETDPPAPSRKLSSVDTLPDIASRRKTEPQKLGRRVRGELDWIVMKAIVGGMVMALRNHASGSPTRREAPNRCGSYDDFPVAHISRKSREQATSYFHRRLPLY